MAYHIEFSEISLKKLKQIPRRDQERILDRIERLCGQPRPSGSKKLVGEENLYRIRSGDYRIIYAIHDDILTILVLKIGHRGSVYREGR